jgi:hypothetical protein
MGDLAFGSSFDMLKSGERHWVLELLEDGMKYLGMFAPIPWIFPVLISIPGAAKDFRTFMNWCGDQIETRRKVRVPLMRAETKGSILICVTDERQDRCPRRESFPPHLS